MAAAESEYDGPDDGGLLRIARIAVRATSDAVAAVTALLFECGVDAVLDTSEVGEPEGLMFATLLLPGRRDPDRLDERSDSDAVLEARIRRELAAILGPDIWISGLSDEEDENGPDDSDEEDVTDLEADADDDSRTFDELLTQPWRGLVDAVTTVSIEPAALPLLAAQTGAMRVARVDGRGDDRLRLSGPAERLVSRQVDVRWEHGPGNLAFANDAVTFLRFARRRGFMLTRSSQAVIGVWDRQHLVVRASSAGRSGDDPLLEGALSALVDELSSWEEFFAGDAEVDPGLRALVRERASREDSFERLAGFLDVPPLAARAAENAQPLPDEHIVEPAGPAAVFRAGLTESLASSPLGGWSRLTARRPVIRVIYLMASLLVGGAGILRQATVEGPWWAYLLPVGVLLVAAVDFTLSRLVDRSRLAADGTGPDAPDERTAARG